MLGDGHAPDCNSAYSPMKVPQVCFGYCPAVAQDRDLSTIAARVSWALQQCLDRGLTLSAMAAEIGCTHATLSQWLHAKTNVENAKVGLLARFCEISGYSMDWLLTGKPPRQLVPDEGTIDWMVTKLVAMERDAPTTYQVFVRFLASSNDQAGGTPSPDVPTQ